MFSLSADMYPMNSCRIELKNRELWKKFHELDTEMIITKSGRRLFPALSVEVHNLDPNAHYCVYLEMVQLSKNRYKFTNGEGWCPTGPEEKEIPCRIFLHPDSPRTGRDWMEQPVSFHRIKLTNTASSPQGNLMLSSMHKYQPRIVVAKTIDPREARWALSASFSFPETSFIAVTAYQNEKITKLKIENNPFAKGFRMSGHAKCKKRHCPDDEIIVVTDDDPTCENLEPSAKKRIVEDSCSKEEPIDVESTSKDSETHPVAPFHINERLNIPFPTTNTSIFPHYRTVYHYPPYTPYVWRPMPYPAFFSTIPNLSVNDVKVTPKKFTDFSIKAITGSS